MRREKQMIFFLEWSAFLHAHRNIFIRPLVGLLLLCIALFLAGLAAGQAISPFAYRIF
jgi:hypothetical protein